MTVTTVFSAAADGRVESVSSVSYAAARSGGTLTAFTAETGGGQGAGQTKFGATYTLDESFFSFDTSGIADTDVVSAAALSFVGAGVGAPAGFVVEARTFNWGASLTTADWVAGASLSGLTLLATFTIVNTGSWPSSYNLFTESGSNLRSAINLTGITYVMVSTDKMRAGTAPTTDEWVNFQYADTSGTTSDPKLVVTSAPALVNYTLTAAVGAFTETGIAAGLSVGRKLTATPNSPASANPIESFRKITRLSSAGALALSGQAATLRKGYTLSASAGAFTETGRAAGLSVGHTLSASAGAFTLTGQAAELDPQLFGRESTGAYVLTGQAAGLRVALHLSASAGSFAITGGDTSGAQGKGLAAQPGAFALTGQDAGLRVALHLSATPGSYVLNGQDAAFRVALSLLTQRGSFLMDGQDAALRVTLILAAAAGSYVLDGQDAALHYAPAGAVNYSLAAATGSYAITGQAAGLTLVPLAPVTPPRRGGGFPGPAIPTPRQTRPPLPLRHVHLVVEPGQFRVEGQPVQGLYILAPRPAAEPLPAPPALLPRAIHFAVGAAEFQVGGRTARPLVARRMWAEGGVLALAHPAARLAREPYVDNDEEWMILDRFTLRDQD